jgi:hypothetical protein
MKTPNYRIGLLASALLAASALVACGGGGSSSGGSGTLGVSMTDAPACGYDHVNVTVNKIRVNQSASASDTDAGWIDIVPSTGKIDLLNLTNGVLQALGETPLAAGHYSQLRLVLDPNTGNTLANSVVPTATGVEQTLITPSAVQSGIKLVNEFDVVAGQRVDLVLDFDACKSVVSRGNGSYALKPVVKVIPTVLNGISGFVSTALLSQHVMVSAQQNGVVVSSTTPNATTGEFFLARLVPGNYDVVLTADNSASAVVGAVPVASTTSTTALSTSAAPITLAASATGSIGGTVGLTPVSLTETAFVSAKQSFAAGPTVTVKYQGVEAGAYSLTNLPLAAPWFAAYSATLPLTFSAQTNTVPGTAKYAVSAAAFGYATSAPVNVDIGTANQTGVNFALVP